jgi:hypothetical protein
MAESNNGLEVGERSFSHMIQVWLKPTSDPYSYSQSIKPSPGQSTKSPITTSAELDVSQVIPKVTSLPSVKTSKSSASLVSH